MREDAIEIFLPLEVREDAIGQKELRLDTDKPRLAR
jgi:hypothetical protein